MKKAYDIAQAKSFFYLKDYKKALEIFALANDFYSAGLCNLLLQNVNEAKKYWSLNKKNCPASSWGLCVLELINLKTKINPGFFQVRAFLEVYLNLFLENNLTLWAENIINSCDLLFKFNPETYKFIARALFANGYFPLAVTFCKKSLKFYYSDPEAFLIMAQSQYLLDDKAEALDSVNRIIYMASDYYPALLFRDILKKSMS